MNSFNVRIDGKSVTVVMTESDIEIRDQENQLIMDLVNQQVINDLRERAEAFRSRLRRYPPGVKFYAYDVPKDQSFCRSNALPTIQELDDAGAGPVTAELIAHMSKQPALCNFKLTGIFHDSRVVEFEYIYKNDNLHSYRY